MLLAGAETWRTRRGLKAKGGKLVWTLQDESVPMAEVSGKDVPMAGDAEIRIGLARPSSVYPLFEQALRIANGESIDDHLKRIGELWARFNAVAVANPHAWIRKPVTAEEIWQPGPQNRMISWPYTKLMNSNNMVDQGAALILTSVEQATRLRVPAERWVYPTRAPTRMTPPPSPSVMSCTARRPSGSRARGRWSWPAWASTMWTTSTCTPAFPRPFRSRRANWGSASTTQPARSPSRAG